MEYSDIEQLQKLIHNRIVHIQNRASKDVNSRFSKDLGDESDEDVYQPIYFDQTSKFQGSMVNRNMFSMDGEFVGKIKDSGPDYSIQQTNLQQQQNTFKQSIQRRNSSQNDSQSQSEVSDEEAHQQYDSQPLDKRDGSFNSNDKQSFEEPQNFAQNYSNPSTAQNNPQQSSLQNNVNAKNKKRKKITEKKNQQKQTKTLTFVDMTHLSYLSKSLSSDMHLNEKLKKAVHIPMNTKIAIIEDESEDDDSESDQTSVKQDQQQTVHEMCLYFVEQILNVVFQAHDATDLSKYGIVDNDAIKENIHKLHKQVFVKAKIEVDEIVSPGLKKQFSRGMSSKAFENAVNNRKSQQMNNRVSVPLGQQTVKNKPCSMFSEILEDQDPNAFVIQAPQKTNRNYLETKIYFFNTSQNLTVQISTKNTTLDVIKHIMTLYKQSPMQSKNPLKFEDPYRYQLFMIDEYESKYAPDEEMGARPMKDEIGQFESLAFMEVKVFKKQKDNVNQENDVLKKQLENEGKVLVIVDISILQNAQTQQYKLGLLPEEPIYKIYEMVNQRSSTKYTVEKNIIVVVEESKTDEPKVLGVDNRILDPKTIVKNLKNFHVEIRQKVFVDKPVEKQQELTFEQRMAVQSKSVTAQRRINQVGDLGNAYDQKSQQASFQEKKNDVEEDMTKKRSNQQYRKEDDFLYGQISGSQLEQFPLFKYNQKLKPKSIWFCIDGYSISHKVNKDKNSAKQESTAKTQKNDGILGSFTSKIFGQKEKKHPISSIVSYKRYKDPHEFSITYQKVDKKDEFKEVRYRAEYADDASAVIAKIKFLLTTQNSKTGMFNNANRMASSAPQGSNFM